MIVVDAWFAERLASFFEGSWPCVSGRVSMGNCASVSETQQVEGIAGVTNAEIKSRLSQAKRIAVKNAEAAKTLETKKENERNKTRADLQILWMKLFRSAAQNWLATNHESFIASVRGNASNYRIDLKIGVPADLSTRIARYSGSIERFIYEACYVVMEQAVANVFTLPLYFIEQIQENRETDGSTTCDMTMWLKKRRRRVLLNTSRFFEGRTCIEMEDVFDGNWRNTDRKEVGCDYSAKTGMAGSRPKDLDG
ncbi:MAG: hypothetical protein KGL39_01475 [Patescibacteria group bacterium]|nr:hypothetical protein [Patescibacteria group bacterium]